MRFTPLRRGAIPLCPQRITRAGNQVRKTQNHCCVFIWGIYTTRSTNQSTSVLENSLEKATGWCVQKAQWSNALGFYFKDSYAALLTSQDFPGSSVSKESPCSAGDPGSIPGWGRSHGEGNGNPLQYSCLENPMDRGAWWATVHGVTRVRHNLVTKPSPPLTAQAGSCRPLCQLLTSFHKCVASPFICYKHSWFLNKMGLNCAGQILFNNED